MPYLGVFCTKWETGRVGYLLSGLKSSNGTTVADFERKLVVRRVN